MATQGVEVHPMKFSTVCMRHLLSIGSSLVLTTDRISAKSSLMSGIRQVKKSLVVFAMGIISTGNAALSCLM